TVQPWRRRSSRTRSATTAASVSSTPVTAVPSSAPATLGLTPSTAISTPAMSTSWFVGGVAAPPRLRRREWNGNPSPRPFETHGPGAAECGACLVTRDTVYCPWMHVPQRAAALTEGEGPMKSDLERFLAQDGREDEIARVRHLIDENDVKYIYFQFVSVTGRIMGKGVPADHWERMCHSGFQLVYGSTANLFIDRNGDYIGYSPDAWELVGLPDVDTFQILPWDPKTARVFCTLFRGREEEVDPGAYLTSDCRGNLKRIHEDFERETGLHLRVGTEPEMMWLKLNGDGTPSVEGVTKPFCYHIDQFAELQPVIHRVIEYSKAMGLDMIQGDHEDAPGQLELNWQFDRA